MSLFCIFNTLITIIFFTVIKSGVSFRCYVCDTRYDKYCKDNPKRFVKCPEESYGCVKIINNALEYKFFNSNGSEISSYQWDGRDTDWEPIPYIVNIVNRKCGDNYERYKPEIGCKKIPQLNNDDDDDDNNDYDEKNFSKNIICYCKKELCNYSTSSYKVKYIVYIFNVTVNILVIINWRS